MIGGWLRTLFARGAARPAPDTTEAQQTLRRLAVIEQFLLDEEVKMYSQQQERRHDRH